MEADITESSLPVYKALASSVRLQIIQKLSSHKMSVSDLSATLNLSSTIVLQHLNKLATAGIVKFERSGHNKIARLTVDQINVQFPQKIYPEFESYSTDVPVGHFTNFSVKPSCGLAGKSNYIGKVDNPVYFMDPDRITAGMIWWCNGFVEYQFPNYLTKSDHIEMLDLSMELGSEFPFSNNVWPSDITFYINGTEIGTWTAPGDFSDTRGKYTPEWVPDNVNQYGILKTLRLTHDGTFLDGQPFTDVTLEDIATDKETFAVRYGIKKTAKNNGGCTIFGKGFGNYNHDIEMKLFYS